MSTPTLRLYESKDRDACFSVFDTNSPKYFAADEREDLEGFLDNLPCPYYVMELDGTIIGCGGHGTEGDNNEIGIFSWGMIAQEHHKKGYGQLLADMRLTIMRDDPTITSVRLNTSQHTAPFYARFGFETLNTTKDAFGPGIDDVEMLLTF